MADVTIKLTLGNFSVEVTGPQEYANEKFNDLVAQYLTTTRHLATEPRSATAPTPAPTTASGKQLSAAEFIKKASPRNQSDQAMVLGYFLEKFQGISSFTSTELGTLAKDVKRPFANASDLVSKLTSRGLMMSSGDKEGQRAYAITASGEEYVDSMIADSRP